MLNAEDVDGIDAEEIRRTAKGGDVALADLEASPCGIGMLPAGVVHREHEAVYGGILGRDRSTQIAREGGDSTLTGNAVPEHRDLADGRRGSNRVADAPSDARARSNRARTGSGADSSACSATPEARCWGAGTV